MSFSFKKKSKYRAKAVHIDGIRFASQKEGQRYKELKLMLSAGEIEDLKLQPRFPLRVEGQLICVYVADFRYWEPSTASDVVEDVKGYRTNEYKLKAKLFKAIYPHLNFRET